MSEATNSVAEQVAKLIKDALATIASQGERQKPGQPDLFPDGIGDIHVALTAPGGISIEIDIASSRREEELVKRPVNPGSSVHPMIVILGGGTPVYAKFSETSFGTPTEFKLELGRNNIVFEP